MFKNLNPFILGISGRQSELIELALTHRFRSLDVNIEDFLKKAEKQGVEHAVRFLTSANLRLGTIELPMEWRGTEESYQARLPELEEIGRVAGGASGTVCRVVVEPASDFYPYHDNFELYRKRLTEIGDRLEKHGVRVGLSLQPLATERANKEFQFIHEAEGLVALLKSITGTSVGLYWDLWNWHLGGGTIQHVRDLGVDQVVSVAVADAPPEVDAESATSSQRLLPAEDGQIDITGAAELLREQEYRGPVCWASSPESFAGLSREAVVKRCSELLDEFISSDAKLEAENADSDTATVAQ